MTKSHPANNWTWNDEAETGFATWFNDLYGCYSFRSEWFFGDCEIEDEKTRKEAMYDWLHAAYVDGYKHGFNEAKLNGN